VYSGSFLYNFVLIPLSIFGTTSVCLAFALLLPGVGNALAAIWTLVTADWLWQRRKAMSGGEGTPPSASS
jgi:hypothetical protein